MPAEFGLAMAIFVVLASMVGVGVLTTSGYTVALVGSNQLMLGLWVVGGVIAVCGALTLAELSAALPHTGGDFVYLYEALRATRGISLRLGVIPDRLFRTMRGVGVRVGQVYSGTFWPRCKSSGLLSSACWRPSAILIFAVIHISGRERTAKVQGWITGLKIAVLVLLVVGRTCRRLATLEPTCSDAKPVDCQPGDDHDVLAGLHLLRLYRLEWCVLPCRRDSRCPEDPASSDPAGNSGA